ncbi:hypothetical protein DIPPA_08000 [Diplonema papillatum]|nr:hypothetical protein DIPPA_08000 [Diplonema papillatum]
MGLPDWDLPELYMLVAALFAVDAVLPEIVPEAVLAGLTWLLIITSLFFYALVQYFTVAVMHKRAPVLPFSRWFWNMLWLVRPLQLLYRFATAVVRVTPDVVIIGEVRCGTTTTAEVLATLPGCRRPFSMWRVPFADRKETFYLVGHHLGLVHPLFYRAFFPTVFEKALARAAGRPFFTFDACAQYAAAPWAAAHLARINPAAKIVHCIREPVSQNISWWTFHRANDSSLAGLGLADGFVAGREQPESLAVAFRESASDATEALYARAERELSGPRWFLPLWAVTWPRGQGYALTQCGRYALNAKRYIDKFGRNSVFFVEVAQLQTAEGVSDLAAFVRSAPPKPSEDGPIHLNANGSDAGSPADGALRKEMKAYYEPHNAEFAKIVGRPLNW